MTKDEHNCDNVNCNHNNTKGLCCLHNPENCKYRQLQKEIAELSKELNYQKQARSIAENAVVDLTKENAELKKENAELEEKISVLLSCKNCPENKGGLICQKEYENKCLAQKIEFIKELQKENAELEEKLANADYQLEGRDNEIAELKIARNNCEEQFQNKVDELAIEVDRVIRAKELLKEFVEWATWQGSNSPSFKSIQDKAEQLLSDIKEG